jgi:hypothetical protein
MTSLIFRWTDDNTALNKKKTAIAAVSDIEKGLCIVCFLCVGDQGINNQYSKDNDPDGNDMGSKIFSESFHMDCFKFGKLYKCAFEC